MLNRSNMKWIRLHAPEGSIIFNAGDYLQRITNDGEAAEGQEHQEGEGTVSVYMVSVCMYRCIAPRSFRLSLSLSFSTFLSLSLCCCCCCWHHAYHRCMCTATTATAATALLRSSRCDPISATCHTATTCDHTCAGLRGVQ